MDPKLSNPNNQIDQPVSNQPQNPTAPQAQVDPVVQQNPVEPVPVSQAPPQYPIQQPTTLPPVQPLPPIQNTPPIVTPPTSQNEPVTPPPDTNFDGLPKKHLISKKVAAIAVVLFLAVSIPLTVFVTNQQQNIKSGAANPITDATVVGNLSGVGQITVGDITSVALENYAQDQFSADSYAALKNARDIYVERKILDQKETELGLTVSQSDIDVVAADTGLSLIQARYELLKQQVILTQVNYVKGVSIGYWLPPDDAGQNYASGDQAIITNQSQEGKNAIDQATTAFNSGQDVLTIAQSISENSAYSNLKSVLSMNGYKFAQIPDADKATAAEPVLYEYGGTNFDDQTKTTLFGAAKDTVVTSVADQSSGGKVVFKIIDKGTGTFNSYSDWLSQQEANLYTKVAF